MRKWTVWFALLAVALVAPVSFGQNGMQQKLQDLEKRLKDFISYFNNVLYNGPFKWSGAIQLSRGRADRGPRDGGDRRRGRCDGRGGRGAIS